MSELMSLSWFTLFDILVWVGYQPNELSIELNKLQDIARGLEPWQVEDIQNVLNGRF